jgi:hypothetical protein
VLACGNKQLAAAAHGLLTLLGSLLAYDVHLTCCCSVVQPESGV